MIAPHELKDKVFSRAVRGYNPAEVEEYVDFLLEKYTELYKENASNVQKLNVITAKYDSLASDEESIRTAILKAQKLSEVMVDTARKQADTMLNEAKARVDSLVKEATERVETETTNLETVRSAAKQFRDQICNSYVKHLEFLKSVKIGTLESLLEDMPEPSDIEKAATVGVAASMPDAEEEQKREIALLTDQLDSEE